MSDKSLFDPVLIKSEHVQIQAKKECNQCEKTFKKKRDMRNHLRKQHTNVKRFDCKICDQQFSFTGFQYHMRMHKGENPKYKCTYCEKLFWRIGNLNNHK